MTRPPRLPRPDADLTLWWEPFVLAGLLLVWAPVEVWRRWREDTPPA